MDIGIGVGAALLPELAPAWFGAATTGTDVTVTILGQTLEYTHSAISAAIIGGAYGAAGAQAASGPPQPPQTPQATFKNRAVTAATAKQRFISPGYRRGSLGDRTFAHRTASNAGSDSDRPLAEPLAGAISQFRLLVGRIRQDMRTLSRTPLPGR